MRGLMLLPLLLAACVAQAPDPQAAGPEAADPEAAGFTPIDVAYNADLKRYLPPGVSASNLLLSADTCYYYEQEGKILPVRTEAGRYCIG